MIQTFDALDNLTPCVNISNPLYPTPTVSLLATESGLQSFLAVTCVHDGLYQATLTGDRSPGTYTVTITVGGALINSNSSVTTDVLLSAPSKSLWRWISGSFAMFVISGCFLGVGVVALIVLYRRKRQESMLLTEINDWTEFAKSDQDLSLASILDDPEIRHIEYTDLQIEEHLATGGGGTVHRAIWTDSTTGTQLPVAVKHLHFTNIIFSSREELRQICVEIKLASSLKHNNILPLLGISIPKSNELCLVTEYMPRGSLDTVLSAKGLNLPSYHRFKLAIDAACGLQYLHARQSM
jgi:hypothetical protein